MTRRLIVAVALAALVSASCTRGPGVMRIDAIFANVGDLPRFAQVQVADVRIGLVTSIRLEGYHARVTMRIDAAARLPANSIALARGTSLLGERFVEIRAPEGPSAELLADGDLIPLERTGTHATLDDAFIQLGNILQEGNLNDFAAFISSAATIVRDKEEQLGEVFTEFRRLSGVLAGRSAEISAAIENLDTAFGALAEGSETLRSAVSSSADASRILADQQGDLERLVTALDRFASVSAAYSAATTPANDRALKDLRLILDEVMKTTGDLEASLIALARFTDLWPRALPGDYVQLDVVVRTDNTAPSSSGGAPEAAAGIAPPPPAPGGGTLADIMWRAVR